MICYLFPEPIYFLFSTDIPPLLYYILIPSTLVALMLSSYIFFHNKKSLLNGLLFSISIFFTAWTMATLVAWTSINSSFLLFTWSFFNLILGLISIFSVYFIYVFLNKKDISIWLKSILLLLVAPFIFLGATKLNLSGFNLAYCDAYGFESTLLQTYSSFLGLVAMLWILVLLIRKYRTSEYNFKKQILLMGFGIEIFLFFFFGMEFVATYFTKIGWLPDSSIELYGLIGMVIFMVYIAILSVRFKAFNIKLLATQALVWGLVILVGSQFFFIQGRLNFILASITFVGSIIFGSLLIRSVNKEIYQRRELTNLNLELQGLLNQREALIHLITHKIKAAFTRSKYIFSEMLVGSFGDITDELKKMAENGLFSDNEGIKTVDLILNSFNLEKGIVKFDMKEVEFKKIVEESMAPRKLIAEDRGVALKTDFEGEEFIVSGDPIWLSEITSNLIENAVRYTKEGEIIVGLKKKKDKLIFSVKDTGVGINAEDKKNLFTPGGRGKNSIKVNVDSTGYGLYSVKLIVEAHGGRIWVESEGDNKGSQFFVELNLVK
jgi:signal transduction histidine kinase